MEKKYKTNFQYADNGGHEYYIDNPDGTATFMDMHEVCDELNKLHEELAELKFRMEGLEK